MFLGPLVERDKSFYFNLREIRALSRYSTRKARNIVNVAVSVDLCVIFLQIYTRCERETRRNTYIHRISCEI